jgi:DNA-binding MarR family transcriptional regulator
VQKPDEQTGYLLMQAAFLRQRIVNATLKELDITYIQFIILAGTLEFGDDGKIVTQQLISTERRLDKAMVSNVVKTLIDKGLMIRNDHPEDKRAYTLSLTKSGTEKAIKGRIIALKTDEFFFAGVDKKELSKSLAIILKNDNNTYEQ